MLEAAVILFDEIIAKEQGVALSCRSGEWSIAGTP